MPVKFKTCPRCLQVKKEPLSRNFINPTDDFCLSCKYEMLKKFILCLDYNLEDIFNLYAGRIDEDR